MTFALEQNPVFLGRLHSTQLAAFHDWERNTWSEMAARWEIIPSRPAFDPRAADVAVRDPDVTPARGSRGVIMVNARTGRRVALEGDALVESVLAAIDGRSTCGELFDRVPRPEREAFVSTFHRLLGAGITLPAAVDALEGRVPHAQLVRFPQQSPYAVPRAYWENAIAIRESLPLLYRGAHRAADFVEVLLGFHRIAALGESGDNYYGSATGVLTDPGTLRQSVTRTVISEPVLRAIEHWLAQLGVQAPLLRDGLVRSREGDPVLEIRTLGRHCVHLCRDGDPALRSLLEEARQQVLAASEALARSCARSLIAACARFQQLFLSAHPFTTINNSIAMNIVNDLLTRGGLRAMPHLFLDYLAPRLTPSDFAAAFEVAVSHPASAAGGHAEALLRLVAMERLKGRSRQTSTP